MYVLGVDKGVMSVCLGDGQGAGSLCPGVAGGRNLRGKDNKIMYLQIHHIYFTKTLKSH